MSGAVLLEGKRIKEKLIEELQTECVRLTKDFSRPPKLVAIDRLDNSAIGRLAINWIYLDMITYLRIYMAVAIAHNSPRIDRIDRLRSFAVSHFSNRYHSSDSM